jgi:hypothetical protein
MNIRNKRILIVALSVVLGFIAGFIYFKTIGCSSGKCAITSHWYSSTFFGGVFGYLIGDTFAPKQKPG